MTHVEHSLHLDSDSRANLPPGRSTTVPMRTRLSFSAKNPNLQLAWDSTSLGAFKTCPRYYFYNIVLGKVSHPQNVHLIFGQCFHAACEEYDRVRFQGGTHKVALRSAVRRALVDTWDSALGRPWNSDDKYKNRETLIRTIVWYYCQFEDDPIETARISSGQPAVELSWRLAYFPKEDNTPFKMRCTDEQVTFCGHLDRIGVFNNKLWIVDRKTTKSTIGADYFAKYSPDNQFSAYTYAGRAVFGMDIEGIIVDAAQVAVEFTRFQRGMTYRTASQLEEWRSDTEYWLYLAEHCAVNEYWPMNDRACNNYGGCPYRLVCGKPPEERETWLRVQYKDRLWDPLRVRSEI